MYSPLDDKFRPSHKQILSYKTLIVKCIRIGKKSFYFFISASDIFYYKKSNPFIIKIIMKGLVEIWQLTKLKHSISTIAYFTQEMQNNFQFNSV